MDNFVDDHDVYPMHWLMHIVHAFEILGYKHPTYKDRQRCLWFYELLAHCFHLFKETEIEMDLRLNA